MLVDSAGQIILSSDGWITVALQLWIESERGWGTRPEHTLHLTTEDARSFRDAWCTRQANGPDRECYSQPLGAVEGRERPPELIDIPGAEFNRLFGDVMVDGFPCVEKREAVFQDKLQKDRALLDRWYLRYGVWRPSNPDAVGYRNMRAGEITWAGVHDARRRVVYNDATPCGYCEAIRQEHAGDFSGAPSTPCVPE